MAGADVPDIAEVEAVIASPVGSMASDIGSSAGSSGALGRSAGWVDSGVASVSVATADLVLEVVMVGVEGTPAPGQPVRDHPRPVRTSGGRGRSGWLIAWLGPTSS